MTEKKTEKEQHRIGLDTSVRSAQIEKVKTRLRENTKNTK